MRAPGFILALLAAAGAARAAEAPVEVISPRADSISVTIYRDLFALITETRTVDLPAGAVKLSFDGVVETLLPASAVVTNTGRALEERNFDYEQLTPNSLFSKSIGREVMITRTHERTGKIVRFPATIVSANQYGVVLRTTEGREALYCSGMPEQVTFERIPDGLQRTPRLSLQLAPGPAGKRTIRVSYLAHGFSWRSDYVGRIGARGDRMDLQGWVTLRNLTNTSFHDAQVQVVAGRLHLLDEDEHGTSPIGPSDDYPQGMGQREARDEKLAEMLEETSATEEYDEGTPWLFSGCFGTPNPARPGDDTVTSIQDIATDSIYSENVAELIVTGARRAMAEREELADYQLYRLPWPTNLAARQTKQAVFLDKRAVKIERFYSLYFDAYSFGDDQEYDARLMLGFENRKSSGLGEPLPEGLLRLFETGPTGDLFSGEMTLEDTAVNEPVEGPFAGAVDLALEVQVETDSEGNLLLGAITEIADAQIRIANAKGVPVTVEIRQEIYDHIANAKIARANHRTQRKHGDYVWRALVPASSAELVTYQIRFESD